MSIFGVTNTEIFPVTEVWSAGPRGLKDLFDLKIDRPGPTSQIPIISVSNFVSADAIPNLFPFFRA
jgi:hypothetical protein